MSVLKGYLTFLSPQFSWKEESEAMNKRILAFAAAMLLTLAANGALAQMGGGGMHGSGRGNSGSGMAGDMMAGDMGQHDLTVGPDGTAYVIDPVWTNDSQVTSTVTAISPRTTLPNQWRITVAGFVHQLAAASDKLVLVALTQGMMSGTANQGMHGSNPGSTTAAAAKSKLFILSVTNGAQLRATEFDGMVTALTVSKVENVDYAYLVIRVSSTGTSATPTFKLSIYRLDTGNIVKTVDVNADLVLEQE